MMLGELVGRCEQEQRLGKSEIAVVHTLASYVLQRQPYLAALEIDDDDVLDMRLRECFALAAYTAAQLDALDGGSSRTTRVTDFRAEMGFLAG